MVGCLPGLSDVSFPVRRRFRTTPLNAGRRHSETQSKIAGVLGIQISNIEHIYKRTIRVGSGTSAKS